MTDPTHAALEQAAHELDIAENALLCSSFHNAAIRAKQAAMTARAALSQPELRIIRTDRDEAGPYMLLAEPEPEAAGEGPTDGKLEEMFGAALLKLPGDSLNRAAVAAMRAAIAADRAQRQPVPVTEGPTDEEIMGLMPQQMHKDLATAARAMAEQTGANSTRVKGAMRIILNQHTVDLARAVLFRWGRHAPLPVPVSERPWERKGWCDEQGKCWLCGKVEGDWRFLSPTNSGLPHLKYGFTHCLPAHALPLPVEVES